MITLKEIKEDIIILQKKKIINPEIMFDPLLILEQEYRSQARARADHFFWEKSKLVEEL